MRRFMISAAALALLAVTACVSPISAQPESRRVGKASVAPQVQDRAQAELRHQAPPQQMQQQGGGRGDRQGRGDRGGAPPAQAAIQPTTPGNRADRGNWQGRGDRGPATQATIQSPGQSPGAANRGDRDRRGNWQGRDNRGDRGDSNRGNFNRGDFNRDGRTDYRPDIRRGASYGGPRHDFSGFRDYHRSFRAQRRFRAPFYSRPAGWYDHRWGFGEFLPTAFWARDYWLSDYSSYDLPPPPYGAVWVRVGNDALLVDEESGEIITVEYDIFY
jgi:Ni/Co efflux regulator RcnB